MNLSRVHVARALFTALALATAASALAQTYPTRPIRVLVPFAPGASDTQIRTLGPTLAARLGQPILVENVPGGSGTIAANQVKNAPPDGHTLFYTGTGALTLVPMLRPEVTYRLADFVPIANVAAVTGVTVVRADAPYKTMAEMVAYAKQNPNKMNFGSSGAGTASHTMLVGPQAFADIRFTHIPYKGSADVIQAMVGGTIDIGAAIPSVVVPQIQAGKLRALAVTDGQRSEFLPDVSTYRELGIDYIDGEHYGLVGPKGLPQAIVQRLATIVDEAVKTPEFQALMKKTFTSIRYLPPAAYQTMLVEREADWKRHLSNPKFLDVMKN